MAAEPGVKERGRERSIVLGLLADTSMLIFYLLVGLLGGSLTILAEALRGALMIGIEAFSLIVLRRIHRGRIGEYEFGAGKLEQICNIFIASGMLLGALWVVHGVAGIVVRGSSDASPLGLTLAAALNATNVLLNYIAWDEVRAAARGRPSIIMKAQLHARGTKLLSSGFVQLTLTIAAVARDPVIACWADAIGATFVAGYLMVTAVRMYREGLPDLLDRSVDEASQIVILRVLAEHFDEYALFHRLRTRRSGERVFVEIGLSFEPDLGFAEVDRRVAAIGKRIRAQLPGVEVTIVAHASRPPGEAWLSPAQA